MTLKISRITVYVCVYIYMHNSGIITILYIFILIIYMDMYAKYICISNTM